MSISIENTDNKQVNISDGLNDTVLNINFDTNELPGMDLLANNSKKIEDIISDNDSVGSGGGGGYSSGGDSVKKEDFNFFSNEGGVGGDEKKISIDEPISSPPVSDPMVENKVYGNEFRSIHSLSPNEIKNEKIDLLYKFRKLEGQGIRTTMNYNMNSNLEDMRTEYYKLKKQRETENSIKFQRKILMAAVTGAEFLNNKFDPFDVKLDGWSESVNDNINDFDEVFEELAEKYSGKSEIAPEIKLLMMLGGSAFMFHLTQTLFKSSMPGMDDIMKQNPDLMKQFAQAAVGQMASNVRQPPPMQQNVQQPPSRPEMDGPAGLDDLINQMNLNPNNIPDLDNISIISGDTDRRSNSGITLNL